MPTSQLSQIQSILEIIVLINPQSILDVGIGFGKFGFLSREYLEIWYGKVAHNEWTRRIDGIEAFENYITPVHDYIYDQVYIGNALHVVPGLDTRYDLILLIDVLEHFQYEDGRELLKSCLRLGDTLVISTPNDIGHQEICFGNPFEEHKFQWKRRHFKEFRNVFFVPNKYSTVCIIGDKAKRLREAKRNRAIGRAFPLLIPFLKKVRVFLRKRSTDKEMAKQRIDFSN